MRNPAAESGYRTFYRTTEQDLSTRWWCAKDFAWSEDATVRRALGWLQGAQLRDCSLVTEKAVLWVWAVCSGHGLHAQTV